MEPQYEFSEDKTMGKDARHNDWDDSARFEPTETSPYRDIDVIKSSHGPAWSDLYVTITEQRPHRAIHGAKPDLWISMPLNQTTVRRIAEGKDRRVAMVPYAVSLLAPQTPCEAEVGQQVRAVHIALGESLLQEIAGELYDRDAQDIGIVSAFGEIDPGLSNLVRAAKQTLLAPVPATRLNTNHLARALAADVLAKYARIRPTNQRSRCAARLTASQLQRVTEYVREYLGSDISLNDLAIVAGLSRTNFIARFKASLHETPAKFLWRTRMQRAQEMLATSTLPITHIASACGFSSPAHLSMAFKRENGVTPSTYRQERS